MPFSGGHKPPKLGDYFTVATGGTVARVIRLVTHSPVNHAGVYVGMGRVVEVQPGGARAVDVSVYPNAVWSDMDIPLCTRQKIASEAVRLVGTPYSVLDIAALAFTKLTGRATPHFILKRLERNDRLICSQLVDLCYTRAGLKLFKDGRPACDVTPGDLYSLTS